MNGWRRRTQSRRVVVACRHARAYLQAEEAVMSKECDESDDDVDDDDEPEAEDLDDEDE